MKELPRDKRNKLVIGTWPLSGDYGKVVLGDIEKTLRYSVDNGFSQFDTAPSYGNGFSEFCLGKVLGDCDVDINTKVGNVPFSGKRFEIESLNESFHQSLVRLARDRVNILFLHNPRGDIENIEEVLLFMDELKDEGKIAHKGVSLAKNYNYRAEFLSNFDVIQDDANLLAMDFLDLPIEDEAVFMARSPLASGILAGKINIDSTFSPDDHRSGWLKNARLESILKRLRAIESHSDMALLDLAMQFVLSQSRIDKVIFGVKSIDHIDSVVRNLVSPQLEQSVMEDLIALFRNDFGLIDERKLGY